MKLQHKFRLKTKGLPNSILAVLKSEKRGRIAGGLYYRLQVDFTYNTNHMEGSRLKYDYTPFVIAENLRQFYYLGLCDWRKGRRARLIDTCRTGQDVFILGLRQFGHEKLAEKAEAQMTAEEGK